MALFKKKDKDNGYLNAYKNAYSDNAHINTNLTSGSTDAVNDTLPPVKGFGRSKKSLLQEENEMLKKKIQELSALLTPELQNLQHVQQEIRRFQENAKKEQAFLESIQQEVLRQKSRLNTIQEDIIVAQETIELESFALYTPRWDFSRAEDYKNKLREIMASQKSMIKDGSATYGNMRWTVNNSAAKGKKLVKDMMKLCLRSFNNECDAAVSAVRFNNYDRCLNRIYKSAESVTKLGSIMDVGISEEYISLKVYELQLALEYQEKKQEEKERLRELRAQEREEAKALKEMEAARKVAEKERNHYSNALAQISAQLQNADDSEKTSLLEKKSELETHLAKVEENIKDLDYRYTNRRAGYVYIISNIGSFGENIYKIGMTRRLEPQERVDELGDASVPFRFDVHAMIFSDDAPALEAALHKEFERKKVNMINNRKEFFNVSLDEIKEVVHKNHDKVVEFIDVPPADQYRETLKLKL